MNSQGKSCSSYLFSFHEDKLHDQFHSSYLTLDNENIIEIQCETQQRALSFVYIFVITVHTSVFREQTSLEDNK